MESYLQDNIDELMNDSDIEFVFENEDSEKYDVSNDQDKTIHVMEDHWKIQSRVKKRVKKAELMSLKQMKKLKDSQKERRKDRVRVKERDKRED